MLAAMGYYEGVIWNWGLGFLCMDWVLLGPLCPSGSAADRTLAVVIIVINTVRNHLTITNIISIAPATLFTPPMSQSQKPHPTIQRRPKTMSEKLNHNLHRKALKT